MKHHYLRWFLSLVAAGAMTPVSAQITLHEATNVTQTKATLSAEFPDLSVEHGFQYKYGTLPEIDDFSRTALAPQSDPVQITTSGTYAWSARTAKGWVESNTSVPVGQTSSMSAEITLTEETPISFEWAVDSEDNIGIFSFIVNGETIGSITGLVDFEKFSYILPQGKHKIEWQYKKSASTSIGLDLAKARNITFANTTPGEWISVIATASETELTNIYPAQNYLFRAFENASGTMNYSKMGTFNTLNFDYAFSEITVNPITQTKATINSSFNLGNNSQIETGIELRKYSFSDNELGEYTKYFITHTDAQILSESATKGYSYGSIDEYGRNYLYATHTTSYGAISICELTIEIAEPHKIEFTSNGYARNRYSNCGLSFTIDGERIKSWSFYTNPTTFGFEYVIPAGRHHIEWILQRDSEGFVKIYDCKIEMINPWNTSISSPELTPQYLVENLLPNQKYQVRGYIKPKFKSQLSKRWSGNYSEWVDFTTDSIAISNPEFSDITQSQTNLHATINKGDATLRCEGLQYKAVTSGRWIDYPKPTDAVVLLQNINRLRPNTLYESRTYAQPVGCDTLFSKISTFSTLPVIAHKPEILRLAQHEATLQGKVIFGDANIYQRGMQFRKKGVETWEEVEDGGNDSIYTLVRKNLEMGATYQARTYVQPAGCDVIYSDILEFTTLNSYFTRGEYSSTQTTVTFEATLADVDEGIAVDEYGFEYYIYGDGFYDDEANFVPSDIFTIPVAPDGKTIRATVTGLAPLLRIRWQAYAIINGEKIYFREYYAQTQRATLKAVAKKITPTSISLELNATQDGDAIVSQIEYALAETYNDKVEYSVCGNTLTLTKLSPDTKYNFRFRGLVNDRYCPLLAIKDWEYSWFTFETSSVTSDVKFSNITQTKAEMDIAIDAGDDAEITNLRYRLDYGEWNNCTSNVKFKGLSPGKKYYVRIGYTLNGKDYLLNDRNFTTKAVSSSIFVSNVQQTSASITAGASYGDATLVAQGYEVAGVTYDNSKGGTVTELMPDTKYTCRSYVETKEGGRIYSSSKEFTTKSIVCSTEKVTSLSNRSATLNGSIDCDANSSAEFGFQWKKMTGWNSDPAFTKGHKLDDGTISVALVNGMLDPDTDYQCRAAVRYNSKIYYGSWVTFRTEAEYVYYPASVYTIFRTDRENNSLVLCGYYIAGSEAIVSQGYEYWKKNPNAIHLLAAQSPSIVTTDASMQHFFAPGELPAGDYSVRAFVKTESGETIYGPTLGFTASNSGYSEVEEIPCDTPSIKVENSIVKLYNAAGLDCIIARINGVVVSSRTIVNDYEELTLTPGYYIVKLSNGLIEKIRL